MWTTNESQKPNLLASGRVGVQLKSKIGRGGKGMGMKVGKALWDVGRRQSKAQIVDRAAERSCFLIQISNVILLLRSKYYGNRSGLFFVVVRAAAAADDVRCPCEQTGHFYLILSVARCYYWSEAVSWNLESNPKGYFPKFWHKIWGRLLNSRIFF